MSSQNKEIVRRAYEAFQRGDIDAILDTMTDDADWNLPGAAPYSGIRHGKQQIRQFFTDLQRAVQIDEFDVDDILADGDKVVVLGRERATSRETGRHYEQQWAHLFTFRGGKIAAAHFYEDTHATASIFGESSKERQALTGPGGITHEAYSGRSRE